MPQIRLPFSFETVGLHLIAQRYHLSTQRQSAKPWRDSRPNRVWTEAELPEVCQSHAGKERAENRADDRGLRQLCGRNTRTTHMAISRRQLDDTMNPSCLLVACGGRSDLRVKGRCDEGDRKQVRAALRRPPQPDILSPSPMPPHIVGMCVYRYMLTAATHCVSAASVCETFCACSDYATSVDRMHRIIPAQVIVYGDQFRVVKVKDVSVQANAESVDGVYNAVSIVPAEGPA